MPSFSGQPAAGRSTCASAPVLGRVVGVLHDHQLALPQRGREALGVRLRDDRVRGDDPDRPDLAALDRLRQLGRRHARPRRDPRCARRQIPQPSHLDAILRRGDRAVAGQQRREAAALASAHRVRLAGQGQRAGAGPPDVPGREAEVDQRLVLQRADGRLVRAHRPQHHRALRRAEAVRDVLDRAGVDPAHRRRALRRPLGGDRERVVEPGRVPFEEGVVEQPVALEHVQQRVQQRQVGAGTDLQVDVCRLGGRRAARVDDDHVGALLLTRAHAPPHDRMTGGGVGAEHEQAVGLREVRVAGRRPVGAERAAVTGDRGGHAQARVRVDVVGAEEALEQLHGGVVVLRQQLAGEIEGDRVRTVRVAQRGDARGEVGDRLLPARRLPTMVGGRASQHGRRAVRRRDRVRQPQRLLARRTAVDRVQRIALDPLEPPAGDVREQPAAGAAVRAGRADGGGLACAHGRRSSSAPSRSATS